MMTVLKRYSLQNESQQKDARGYAINRRPTIEKERMLVIVQYKATTEMNTSRFGFKNYGNQGYEHSLVLVSDAQSSVPTSSLVWQVLLCAKHLDHVVELQNSIPTDQVKGVLSQSLHHLRISDPMRKEVVFYRLQSSVPIVPSQRNGHLEKQSSIPICKMNEPKLTLYVLRVYFPPRQVHSLIVKILHASGHNDPNDEELTLQ
ncbi:hypothetical protein ABKN59_011860 [Abortiporus biennis]